MGVDWRSCYQSQNVKVNYAFELFSGINTSRLVTFLSHRECYIDLTWRHTLVLIYDMYYLLSSCELYCLFFLQYCVYRLFSFISQNKLYTHRTWHMKHDMISITCNVVWPCFLSHAPLTVVLYASPLHFNTDHYSRLTLAKWFDLSCHCIVSV